MSSKFYADFKIIITPTDKEAINSQIKMYRFVCDYLETWNLHDKITDLRTETVRYTENLNPRVESVKWKVELPELTVDAVKGLGNRFRNWMESKGYTFHNDCYVSAWIVGTSQEDVPKFVTYRLNKEV
jgi:hypothetical protein